MADTTNQTAAPTAALTIEHLTVSAATDHGRFRVVDDVSLTLDRGGLTGLVGESGSGKTVTGLAAMRLLPEPTLRREAGGVIVGESDMSSLSERALRSVRGERISMIFQEPMTSLDPVFTVGQLIGEVLRSHRAMSKRAAKRAAVELLNDVGIPDARRRVDEYPFQFSGGMRQRVLIAMAMACEPAVIIADEPTTALDVTVQAQILDLLRSISIERDVAILLITHDLGVVAEFCDRTAVMYAGQLVEIGPTGSVLGDPTHPYTAALLSSVPSASERAEVMRTISGTVPPLHEMPDGCRFAPRCEHARPECEAPIDLRVRGDRQHRCVRSDELDLRVIR